MSDSNLPKYGFIPWARKGLGTLISEEEMFNSLDGAVVGRPEIHIGATIKNGGNNIGEPVYKDVKILGPGDIIGFNPEAIVKIEPSEGRLNNFERNYFPYVEFYEEDFPWRFTPAKAVGQKLRPWLTLAVLKESEFEKQKEIVGHFASVKISNESVLQDPAELWAWAHVQYNGDLLPGEIHSGSITDTEAENNLKSALSSNPDLASSRLLCPRILEPNTKYTAFLIPTYESGRRAGLGVFDDLETIPAQQSSYQYDLERETKPMPGLFPIYFQWEFATGPIGDFEELVRKLVAIEPDKKVGKRPMYVGDPGYGLTYPGNFETKGILELEGALVVPNADRKDFISAIPTSYRQKLASFINLSEDLLDETFDSDDHYLSTIIEGDDGDDPIVTADLYGRFHSLKNKVDIFQSSWVHELNLDPRNRAIAGLGTEYVQQNQEKLMDSAWGQLDEISEANDKINWGQLGRHASDKGFQKNIAVLSEEKQVALFGNVLSRVNSDNSTALNMLRQSKLPNASVGLAYRKLERAEGPLMKRISKKNATKIRPELAESENILVSKQKQFSSKLTSISSYKLNEQINQSSSDTVKSDTSLISVDLGKENSTPLSKVNSLLLTEAYSSFIDYFDQGNWNDRIIGEVLELGPFNTAIRDVITPLNSITAATLSSLVFMFPEREQEDLDKLMLPIMAYPVFKEPVYEYIKNLGKEYLVPNLHLIPDNSITLMETNQRYIESFMVGLNHAMGKELLWREFPTDRRGSYFRQFWNVADIPNLTEATDAEFAESKNDIKEIHEWFDTDDDQITTLNNLGENAMRPATVDQQNLVLVIRGELLRKYPNVVIYAQKGQWKEGEENVREPVADDDFDNIKIPIFKAEIQPDVYLLGFDLTAEVAEGFVTEEEGPPGWYFVLRERPGEVRFGMDEKEEESLGPGEDPSEWNDLNLSLVDKISSNGYLKSEYITDSAEWPDEGIPVDLTEQNPNDENHEPNNFKWGENSAVMAQILYQNPVMVCIHANEMLS